MTKTESKLTIVKRLTGLSGSTINRVLTGEGYVSKKAADKVEAVLRQQGFTKDSTNKWTSPQIAAVRVLLSEGTNPFFEQLEQGVSLAIEARSNPNYKFTFDKFDPYDPKNLIERLLSVPTTTSIVVTVGVDTPEVENAINRIVAQGIEVITIVSDVPSSKRSTYIGQNNFEAGNEAGRLMSQFVQYDQGEIAVLIGHSRFRHLLERQMGFAAYISKNKPGLTISPTLPYETNTTRVDMILDSLLSVRPKLKGIYLAGGGQPYLIQKISNWAKKEGIVLIGHELTSIARAKLNEGGYSAIIAHDVWDLSEKTVEAVINKERTKEILCKTNVYLRKSEKKD